MSNKLDSTYGVMSPDEQLLPEKVPTAAHMTPQQRRAALLYISGMKSRAIAAAVGTSTQTVNKWIYEDAAFREYVEDRMEEIQDKVTFTVQHAHAMYMEAWAACGTATEMKMVVDSLVRLHRLVDSDSRTQVNVQINNTTAQRMSDEELLKAIGRSPDYLEPASTVIDAQSTEIKDE